MSSILLRAKAFFRVSDENLTFCLYFHLPFYYFVLRKFSNRKYPLYMSYEQVKWLYLGLVRLGNKAGFAHMVGTSSLIGNFTFSNSEQL